TKVGENFTDKLLRNIPLRVRSYQGALGLAPGVISPPGTTTTGAGNIYASGGGLMNNTFTVDGVDTTDPATHTVNLNINFDAISEIQVTTAGLGAENPTTIGAVANVVTKSGSNQLEIDSSLIYQDQDLTFVEEGEANAPNRTVTGNFNVGGPIIRDKLWYY